MRLLLRYVSTAALMCVPYGVALADCRQHALEVLRASSPDGYSIYRQTSRPDFFRSWIDCSDAQFDLSTAVHESTHFVTGETDAFPLVGGGAIARPHEVSAFLAPYRIAGQFKPDGFTTIYLARGKASSATDFLYLLDELNAYTHDLNAAVDLKTRRSADMVVDHRDGLAAMMAFVSTYAETARTSDADTWRGLLEPPAKTTVATLWTHAESVMASSCGIPNFGAEDKTYIARVCNAGPRSAMATVLGRPPACPAACLAPDPAGDEQASEDSGSDQPTSDDDSTTGSIASDRSDDRAADDRAADDRASNELPRHPFALGPRRHKRVQQSRVQQSRVQQSRAQEWRESSPPAQQD